MESLIRLVCFLLIAVVLAFLGLAILPGNLLPAGMLKNLRRRLLGLAIALGSLCVALVLIDRSVILQLAVAAFLAGAVMSKLREKKKGK